MLFRSPYLPNTTDWYGRWRLRANRDNDYELDRSVQRHKSFSGIEGVQLQDQAIQESMGEIVDRENEVLASSDVMVARVRRLLMDAAIAWRDQKKLPTAADLATVYEGVRGGQFLAGGSDDWVKAYEAAIQEAPWEDVGKTESLV